MPLNKAPSIFADGWSEEKRKKLDATELPEKLRCKKCEKLRAISQFSQRQLGVVKQSLARNPRLAQKDLVLITCRQCTEGQVMELECNDCGVTKSLEGFTKAQRRDPDFARCIICVNKHQRETTAADEDAELEEHRHESSGDDDDQLCDDGSDDGSDGETNPYASNDGDKHTISDIAAQAANPTVQDQATARSLNKSRAAAAQTGNDENRNPWLKYAQQHGGETVDHLHNKGKGPTSYTGYDSFGTPHSRIHNPSTVAGSSHTVAPRSNFARVKAYKPPPPPKSNKTENPEPQVRRGDGQMEVSVAARDAQGHQRESHDSDSDSDFGVM